MEKKKKKLHVAEYVYEPHLSFFKDVVVMKNIEKFTHQHIQSRMSNVLFI